MTDVMVEVTWSDYPVLIVLAIGAAWLVIEWAWRKLG